MVQEAYQVTYVFKVDTSAEEALLLSLFVSSKQCQYAIFSAKTTKLIELADISLNHPFVADDGMRDMLLFVIHNQFLDQKKFERVNICFLNAYFTLLPEAFAEQTDLKSLLNFSTGASVDMKTGQHKMRYCDFCFAIQSDWIDFFGKTFPNASLRHAGAVAINLLFEQFSLSDKELFLNIHAGQMEIAVKQQKQLQFYNVFSYESKEDILYYLLFTMEQLQLNPLLCKMAIAADLDTSDELIKSIKKYVKQVDFCVFDQNLIDKSSDYTKANHFYFSLLNQHLCAL